MRICSYEKCRRETRTLTKGFCPTCYAVFRRTGSPERQRPNRSLGVTECSHCESKEGPFIKSLCRPCYQRNYVNGSPELKRVRTLCKQPGCDDVVAAHGLCQRHAMRVRRHGDVNAGRPDGWGSKTKHPMYEGWQSMRRIASRPSGVGHAPDWDDFWAYITDVGERPTPSSRLYLIEKTKPYQADNCEWRESILDGAVRNRNAEYQREYRARHPDRAKDGELRRAYKIGLPEYKRLLEEQGYGCAICGSPETMLHPKSGEPMLLAVDHCHDTMEVRGLLCSAHNTALGNFNHSPALLRIAAAYLEGRSPICEPVEAPSP